VARWWPRVAAQEARSGGAVAGSKQNTTAED